jgi:hypothetical protein
LEVAVPIIGKDEIPVNFTDLKSLGGADTDVLKLLPNLEDDDLRSGSNASAKLITRQNSSCQSRADNLDPGHFLNYTCRITEAPSKQMSVVTNGILYYVRLGAKFGNWKIFGTLALAIKPHYFEVINGSGMSITVTKRLKLRFDAEEQRCRAFD